MRQMPRAPKESSDEGHSRPQIGLHQHIRQKKLGPIFEIRLNGRRV